MTETIREVEERDVAAVALDEWTTFRLDGETLAALGHGI